MFSIKIDSPFVPIRFNMRNLYKTKWKIYRQSENFKEKPSKYLRKNKYENLAILTVLQFHTFSIRSIVG